jgi:PTH2 family peptidyl-tRNA hydrolase
MNCTIKQVIVVRDDLKMRKGKFAAQVAHASMKVFFDRGKVLPGFTTLPDPCSPPIVHPGPQLIIPLGYDGMQEWVEGIFTKVVLLCAGLEELNAILAAAVAAKLPHALIVDSGFTEFHGVPTPTCIAIGPAKGEDIDEITGPAGPFACRLA